MPEPAKRFLGIPYVLIVALGSLVLSLALMLLLFHYEPSATAKITDGEVLLPVKSIWIVIVEHIATALFILGIWHAIDHLLIRREFNSEIMEALGQVKKDLIDTMLSFAETEALKMEALEQGVSNAVSKLEQSLSTARRDQLFGLVSTHHDASTYDLSEEIRSSENFTAVMADGYAWTNRHLDAFRQRFSNPSRTTTIITIHPDSDQLGVVSRKSGLSPEAYRQKILWTARQLREIAGPGPHLRLRGHSLVSCHALFMTDSEIVLTPYFLSTQRRSSPVLVIKDAGENSFFRRVASDVVHLEQEAVEFDDAEL